MRRLSWLEHLVEGNIVYVVRLEGRIDEGRLRRALSRVQRKHPALRALIREGPDGLYSEADSAPDIPLRIVSRLAEDDYLRERRIELRTALAFDQPQLRAVWLRSELHHDLLLTTSHRICDGMSMLILVRETLRSLHRDEALIPYEPVTMRDIIGDDQPASAWTRKPATRVLNGMLRLIPRSHRLFEHHEHFLEWTADRTFLHALARRCRAEGVSLHAAFLVALDRALLIAYGTRKIPKWIENPVDIRRGRCPALRSDTVFFGGGNVRVRTGQSAGREFWAKARAINDAMRRDVERELRELPGRLRFLEQLRPVTRAQVQWVVRLGDRLKMNGSWNRFALSNLGRIVIEEGDAPFRVRDLRIYVHSFTFRVLCLVIYTFNDELRFYCVGDETCIGRDQMTRLERELMNVLQHQLEEAEERA
jgi:hypothetical protein